MNYRPSATLMGGTRPKREDYSTAAFLARLARMSPAARLAASRDGFTPRQHFIWRSYYPDEVPIVNGEYEHIALTLADLD